MQLYIVLLFTARRSQIIQVYWCRIDVVNLSKIMIFCGYFRDFTVKKIGVRVCTKTVWLYEYIFPGHVVGVAALIFLQCNRIKGSMNYIRVCNDACNNRLTKIVRPFWNVYITFRVYIYIYNVAISFNFFSYKINNILSYVCDKWEI